MTDRRRAVGTVAAVCGLVSAIFALKGSLISFAERKVGGKTTSHVEIGSLRLASGGAEARDVEIEDAGRGLRMQSETVALSMSLGLGGIRLNRLKLDGVELSATLGSSSGGSGLDRRGTPGANRDIIRELRAMLVPGGVLRAERVSFTLFSRRGAKLLSGRGWASGSPDQEGLRVRGSGRIDDDRGRMSFSGVLASSRASSGTLRLDDVSLQPLLETMEQVGWYRPDSARLDGRIELAKGDLLALDGALRLRGLGVEWSPISERPVVAGAALSFRGFWDGTSLELERSRLRVRKAEIEVSGSFGWLPARALGDLNLRLPETDCQDLLDAIPPSILGEIAGFALEGRIAGSMHLRFDTSHPGETVLQVEVQDRCRFLEAPEAADLGRLRGVFHHGVPGPDGRTYSFETGPGSAHWTALSRVSLFLVQAVLAREDKTFFQHRGFAPFAMELALERNLEEKRFAAGASTISMQLARNLFLARDKTLARKLKEVLLTWWIEKSLGKQEILELYLNVVEFGPGVYGIGPASRHYFGRSPGELSPAESAFLAISLPSPSTNHRQYLRGGLTPGMKTRMERLLRGMFDQGRIDGEALSYGLAELERAGFFHQDDGPRISRRLRSMGSAAPLP